MKPYQIPDESDPSPLKRLVVDPFWPWIASMVAGVWLAWPWFVLNAYALGSPHRERDGLTVLAGLTGTLAMAGGLIWAVEREIIESSLVVELVLLVIVLFKLIIGYVLHLSQARIFATFEYYGGVPAGGWRVVAAGAFARPYVLAAVTSVLWRLVLSGGTGGASW